MDDPLKRAAITLAGFSIAIILLASAMEANSSAGPFNPVWPLVSFLRNIFIWGWVLLLGVSALAITLMKIIELINSHSNAIPDQLDPPRSSSKLEHPKISEEERLIQTRKMAELEAKKKLEEERLKRAEADKKKKELEIRKAKSTQDILEEAMDEF